MLPSSLQYYEWEENNFSIIIYNYYRFLPARKLKISTCSSVRKCLPTCCPVDMYTCWSVAKFTCSRPNIRCLGLPAPGGDPYRSGKRMTLTSIQGTKIRSLPALIFIFLQTCRAEVSEAYNILWDRQRTDRRTDRRTIVDDGLTFEIFNSKTYTQTP